MDTNDAKTGKKETFKVCYSVEVFVDSDSDTSLKAKLYKKHEFEVREYLFTADEIEDDVENQRTANQVRELFKTGEVLKPMFQNMPAKSTLNLFTSN